jgi:ATP-binding protein involved in chromosome partitioning
VGKSTTAVNLALALAAEGASVGLLDADIYGPSIPMMMGIEGRPESEDGKTMEPMENYGVQVMSIGFLVNQDEAMIWRGPMATQALEQLLRQTNWKGLDYLIVDLPPGTGDVALSLSQAVPVAGSVVITTPQTVSVADTRRAVRMYQKLNVPALGLIENMSHFVCPACRHESDIFGKGGGEALASELAIPFLGRVPIYEPIRIGGDTGVPITIAERESTAAEAFRAAARQLAAQLSIASYKKTAIPLIPIA